MWYGDTFSQIRKGIQELHKKFVFITLNSLGHFLSCFTHRHLWASLGPRHITLLKYLNRSKNIAAI